MVSRRDADCEMLSSSVLCKKLSVWLPSGQCYRHASQDYWFKMKSVDVTKPLVENVSLKIGPR